MMQSMFPTEAIFGFRGFHSGFGLRAALEMATWRPRPCKTERDSLKFTIQLNQQQEVDKEFGIIPQIRQEPCLSS